MPSTRAWVHPGYLGPQRAFEKENSSPEYCLVAAE